MRQNALTSLKYLAIISLVFVGGFFYAQEAHAQTPLPDLVLEYASLSGDMAVVYRNDGAAISNQPYIISFQWVDAAGAGLAPKQTLTRSNSSIRGREALGWNNTNVEGTTMVTEQRCYTTGGFFRRRRECNYIQVPRTVTQTLTAYRAARPNPNALLAVMLDDGNRIAESKEDNNSARVGATPYQGPPPAPLTELAIPRATFDGQNLFVVIQNQSAVNISNQPFDVGLQWLDQSGAAVGDKRFIRYKNLASGRVEIIDSRTNITVLEQTGPGINEVNVAETLSEYLANRPASAMKLQITVDERNQILENNENNNTAIIALPPLRLPDLAITKQVQIFNPRQLVFSYANLGQAPLLGLPAFSFWFEWVDASGARVGNHLYWQDRDARSLPPGASAVFVSSSAQVVSVLGVSPLDKVLQNPPPEAVSLKITIDGPSKVREVSEENNTLVLPKPVRPFPDLVFGTIGVVDNVLRVEVQNKGNIPAGPADLMLVWFSSTGAPVASAVLSYATQTIAPNGSQAVALSLSGQRPIERMLANPPTSAARLQLTIDSTRRVVELNEDNNIATLERSVLPVALPDLAITKQVQTLKPGQLLFSFTNANAVPLTTQFPALSFWFEWVDEKGVRVGNLYWHDRSAASVLPGGAISIFNSRGVYVGSTAGAFAMLDTVLKNPSAGATHLKITLDGPNKFKETSEDNNVLLLPKPVVALPPPDFSIKEAKFTQEELTFIYRNAGGPHDKLLSFWLHFADSQGLQSGPLYWLDVEPLPAGAERKFSSSNAKFQAESGVQELKDLLAAAPAGIKYFKIIVDGPARIVESNELNNTTLVERPLVPDKPDLVLGKVEVKDGALQIEVKNGGGVPSVATDIWLMWFAESRTLSSSAAVDLPAMAAEAVTIVTVPLDGQSEASKILREPPAEATRLRIFLDGSRKVEEVNEQNNDTLFDRAGLPKAQAPEPKLELALSVEIVRQNATANKVSSFASGGLLLAFSALLAFGFMMHAHHGGKSGATGFFSVFPLLFTSAHLSYMYLNRCGAQGCSGDHFVRHRQLKNATRTTLCATAGFGVLKIIAAFLAVSVIGPAADLYAQTPEAYVGDGIRATLITKNIGEATATGLKLRLACPPGTAWYNTRLDERDLGHDAGEGLDAYDLKVGVSRRLAVICKIEKSILNTRRFVGDAQYKETGDRRWYSNIVEVAVRPKPESVGVSDLAVSGVGFLPKAEVTGDKQPFSAAFTGILQNVGQSVAAASKSRLRLDIGSDGTWDFTAPTLVEAGEITPGEHETVSWTINWSAPLGTYTFEICADVEGKVSEVREDNNCTKDRFTLQVGQEAVQDEDY